MRRSVEAGLYPATRSAEAIMAHVEPLPLVPATWMKRVSALRFAQFGEQRGDALQIPFDCL